MKTIFEVFDGLITADSPAAYIFEHPVLLSSGAKPPQADEFWSVQATRGKSDHQFRSAGDRRPFAGLGGKQIEYSAQTARRDQFMRLRTTSHDAPLSRRARPISGLLR